MKVLSEDRLREIAIDLSQRLQWFKDTPASESDIEDIISALSKCFREMGLTT